MAIGIMAPVQNKQNPGSSNIVTFNFAMNSGTDTLLVVAIEVINTKNITSVTYDGVAMTSRLNYSSGQLSARYGMWELENPASGTNQIKITFSATVNNDVLTEVQGFTGAVGGGLVGNNDIANSPHSRTRTGITAGSLMMVQSVATTGNASNAMTVNGVTIPSQALAGQRSQRVGCSTIPLSAGNVTVVALASDTWKKVTNSTLEIKVASSTPTNTGNFFLCM
tara:strand:+ start:414 stop:1082 length:669 start_codon:yes stop_codon:yes gene_type:complete